ncbi:sodium-dependent transporter, partial [bacterium]|nr:sodium-dependent transporter [bacterium]
VFSFGLEPSSGAGLVFITLPKIFAKMPFGNFVAMGFFILLFCAAITSGIGMLEVACATLIERLKLSRIKASILLFFIIAIFVVPSTLSFGILSDFKIFNKTIFELFDFLASNILLTFNTIVLCILGGWFLKIKGEMIIKNKIIAACFTFALKYIIPVFLTGLLIAGLI